MSGADSCSNSSSSEPLEKDEENERDGEGDASSSDKRSSSSGSSSSSSSDQGEKEEEEEAKDAPLPHSTRPQFIKHRGLAPRGSGAGISSSTGRGPSSQPTAHWQATHKRHRPADKEDQEEEEEHLRQPPQRQQRQKRNEQQTRTQQAKDVEEEDGASRVLWSLSREEARAIKAEGGEEAAAKSLFYNFKDEDYLSQHNRRRDLACSTEGTGVDDAVHMLRTALRQTPSGLSILKWFTLAIHHQHPKKEKKQLCRVVFSKAESKEYRATVVLFITPLLHTERSVVEAEMKEAGRCLSRFEHYWQKLFVGSADVPKHQAWERTLIQTRDKCRMQHVAPETLGRAVRPYEAQRFGLSSRAVAEKQARITVENVVELLKHLCVHRMHMKPIHLSGIELTDARLTDAAFAVSVRPVENVVRISLAVLRLNPLPNMVNMLRAALVARMELSRYLAGGGDPAATTAAAFFDPFTPGAARGVRVEHGIYTVFDRK